MLFATSHRIGFEQVFHCCCAHPQASLGGKLPQGTDFIVAWFARTCSIVTTPCVCNALRRASEKPLRTAVAFVGFFEGLGTVDVDFNGPKMLGRSCFVKSSLVEPTFPFMPAMSRDLLRKHRARRTGQGRGLGHRGADVFPRERHAEGHADALRCPGEG